MSLLSKIIQRNSSQIQYQTQTKLFLVISTSGKEFVIYNEGWFSIEFCWICPTLIRDRLSVIHVKTSGRKQSSEPEKKEAELSLILYDFYSVVVTCLCNFKGQQAHRNWPATVSLRLDSIATSCSILLESNSTRSVL